MGWLPARMAVAAMAAGVAVAAAAPVRANDAYVAHVASAGLDASDPGAREAALAQAEEQALAAILRRITASRDHARLPVATGPNVAGYVAEATALPDGRLRVALRADAIAQMLQGFGIDYLDEQGPLLAVVPVDDGGDVPVLWSGPNPWLDAWARHPGGAGLVPVVTPLAEFGDVEAVNAAEAIAGDAAALQRLAERYDAGGTLVAVWRSTGSTAEVLLAVTAADGWQAQTSLQMASPEPTVDAVDAVLDALGRLWVEHRLRPSYDGPVSALAMAATFASLADWIAIRRALDEAPVVARFDVPLVSGTGAQLVVHHYADPATLQADLAGAGLVVEQGGWSADGRAGWTLRLAGAALPVGSPSPPQIMPQDTVLAPQQPFQPQPLTIEPAIPSLRLDP